MGEGSASRPGCSLPPGKIRYQLYRRLGGSQGRSGQVRKISPPPGFDPRTIQPVAIRYRSTLPDPHPIGVLSIHDQLVTEAAAYTMQTRGLSGIEPVIRVIERFRTSTVTGIVDTVFIVPENKILTSAIYRDENLMTYARWDCKPRSATKRNELNVHTMWTRKCSYFWFQKIRSHSGDHRASSLVILIGLIPLVLVLSQELRIHLF